MKQNKLYNTAIYCRLSLDDGNKGDSSSVRTQKIIIEGYAKEKEFYIYDYYIDDGYISINDNVDTLYDNNDIAPFKNILNDMYA